MRALLWLTLLTAPLAAEPLHGFELLALADYGDDQLPARYHDGWWALCPGATTRLYRAKVSGRRVANEIGPTIRVSAEPCHDAAVLLRAKEGLSEREVPTATWSTVGEGLARVAQVTWRETTTSVRIQTRADRVQWLVFDGAIRQRFLIAPKDSDWHAEDIKLLWAGDLDGDGALDFVLSMDGDGSDVSLYLSSGAKAGKTLRRAAATGFGGC
jgi:hypothetical protein